MKYVEGAAMRNVFPARRSRLVGAVLVVVAMLSVIVTLGYTEREASAIPPAPVDDTFCYAIDEGTGDATEDQQFLHIAELDSNGLVSLTHEEPAFDAAGNVENIALRNDASELYVYDPAADQMFLLSDDGRTGTWVESTPTDFNLQSLGDIDAMFFQYDQDGNPDNDILWTLTDVAGDGSDDILTGYDVDGTVVGGPVPVAIDAGTIEGATWLPDANGGTGEFFISYGETAAANPVPFTLATLGTGDTPSATPTTVGITEEDVEGLGVDGAGNMYLSTGEDGADANNMYAVDPTDGSTTLITSLAAGTPPAGGDADFEGIDCAWPKIALSKQLTDGPVVNAAGNYEMEFTFVIENQGELYLEDVELTDDFETVFSPATLVGTPTYDDVNGDCSSDAANGTATLNIGQSCTAVWTVEMADLAVGDYENTASVTGTPPNGLAAATADLSEDNAAPSDPEVDTTTTVTVAEDGVIGLAKEATSGPTENAAGNYDIEYTFTIVNMGNVPLSDVTVDDDYAAFGTLVSGPTETSNDCPNPLPVGDTCTIVQTIEADLTAGTYNNSAIATGTTPGGVDVTDTSTSGADPDPDGNDDPTDNEEETSVTITEDPVIGLAKQATSGPTENAAGNYDIEYTFTIENMGDVPLSDVTVDDDYAAFGTLVSGPTETSNDCPNPLPVGDICTIVQTIEADVVPGDYDNSATATGTSPAGVDVTDVSTEGTDPDPDGNGDPTDNGTETTVQIAEDQRIGLAKALTDGPTQNGTNYDLEYTFTVENLGNTPLTNMNLTDDFAAFANAGTIVAGPTETSNNCPDPLPVGGSCEIVWTVTVNVPPGSYNNNANITATSTTGAATADQSTDGTDSDPNGDGLPAENTPTVASFGEDPVIGLAKELSDGPTDNGGDTELEYTFHITNMGDVALSDVEVTDTYSAFANAGTIVSGPTETNNCPNPLPVGGTCTIVQTIVVDVPAGSYDNTATATGTTPTGGTVTDVSNAGTDPDENDNGDPTDPEDETPTTVNLAESPVIGLAKALTSGPTASGDNYILQYTFVIDNLGDVPLSNVGVTDEYTAFSDAGTIVSGPTEVLSTCPTLLAVGASCTIVQQIEVDVDPGDYDNTATASGTSPAGTTVTDVSNAGTDSDENDNGDPTDPEDETPTTITISDPGQATLGNRVWNDLNGNGLQDAGEPGIEGAEILVYPIDANGNPEPNPITTATTDVDGNWSATVDPGRYQMVFVNVTGATLTTRDVGDDETIDSDASTDVGTAGWTDIYTVAAGEVNNTIDAGFQYPEQPGSISDYVWEDTNKNGIQDAGELGVEGVTVTARHTDGTETSDVTDADGSYLIDDLKSGSYTVTFINPADYVFSPANQTDDDADSDVDATGQVTVILGAGEHNDSIDAGLSPIDQVGSLSDKVWEDTDEDGIQDADEPGVADVQVKVTKADGTFVNQTTTDADGLWSIGNLPAGDYVVEFLPTGSRTFTTQGAGDDDTVDSNVDPGTGKTGTITLGAGEHNATIDAGLLPIDPDLRGSISDFVWVDEDGDGIQDPDEPGKSGVRVQVFNADTDEPMGAPVTTLSDGKWEVGNLPDGNYYVVFTPAGSYTLTTQGAGDDETVDSDPDPATGRTGTITIANGANIDTVDAGINPIDPTEFGSIGDRVWEDTNENGVQDADEPGVDGVTVVLYNSNGGQEDTATTAAGGSYLFEDLAPDTYTVRFVTNRDFTGQNAGDDEDADSDADTATGFTGEIVLGDGQDIRNVDAGVLPVAGLGSISNYVWSDTNGNGLQDDGEPGLANTTVILRDSNGVETEPFTTGSDGLYIFDGLAAGSYTVVFDLPGDLEFTTQDAGDETKDSDANPANGEASVTLGAGEHNTTIDAGAKPLDTNPEYGSVSDRVWEDTNENGVQDDGEPGVPGVVVVARDSNGTEVKTATTGPDGSYLLGDLPPADYTIVFKPPVDREFTTQNAGDDEALDSDVNPANGEVDVTVNANDNITNIDAGIVPIPDEDKGSISDYVWVDENENGLQDAGEPPLSGVVVTLKSEEGVEITSEVTGPDGKYLFEGLGSGNYIVNFKLPGTMTLTTANAGDDDLDSDPNAEGNVTVTLGAGEDKDNVDAGAVPIPGVEPGSISNRVWVDTDGDGIQDPGEPGLPNATVVAYNSDGIPVGQDQTNDAGVYQITGLPAGEYTVGVVLPGDLTLTKVDEGDDDTVDSDIDPETGRSQPVTVTAGQDNPTVDIGVLPAGPQASISDLVFRDVDGDGTQDAGEPGVAGVKVYLVNSAGVDVDSTTTDANGAYKFEGVAPGSYRLRFEPADGEDFTQANVGDDGTDSDADPDTGLTPTFSVADGETKVDVSAGLQGRSTIGLAKAVTSGPTANAAGNHVITYTFVIENLGDTALSNIGIADDVAAAFSPATIVSGPTVAGGGTCSAEALAGTASLDAGQSCKAVWSVEVSGMTAGSVYRNQAVVTGTNPNGTEVSDKSDSGSNPDPNGNGLPNDSGEDDSTPVSLPTVTTTNVGPRYEYGGPYKALPAAPTTTFSVPAVTTSEPSPPLAQTGSNSSTLATIAIGLLGAGAALTIGSRRNRDK